MNTVRHWKVGVAIVGFLAAFAGTGCGGGGGGSSVAPSSLVAKTYALNDSAGAAMAVTYSSETRYAFRHGDGQTEGGNYMSTHNGNAWTTTLTSDGGGQQLVVLTFSAANSGSFRLHREGETDRTGSFNLSNDAVSNGDVNTTSTTTGTGTTTGATSTGDSTTTGSTTTGSTSTGSTSTGSTSTGSTSTGSTTTGSTTSGSTTTGTTAGYTGFAPVSLNGRTMFGTRTFTSTGTSGQTHTYTFTATTFHDSDAPEESGGTYTFSASNSHATLELSYNTPTSFKGDHHSLTMTFNAKDQGTFESTYSRGDGTQIVINGTFEIQ